MHSHAHTLTHHASEKKKTVDNNMIGTLPSEIVLLTNLRTLRFDMNLLYGSLPLEMFAEIVLISDLVRLN